MSTNSINRRREDLIKQISQIEDEELLISLEDQIFTYLQEGQVQFACPESMQIHSVEHFRSLIDQVLEDDRNGRMLDGEEVFAEFKAATKARIMTYGIKNESEIMAKNIELYIDHSEFDLSLKGNLYHIVCPTIADFNIYNVLATVGVLVGLGFDDRMIIEAISDLKPVNGRMELIPNKHKITIIVDYCCHTKDFENVFKFADRVSRGNIIAVLGAPSKRHMARRKKIGALANRYLDHVILTELDDRGENIEEICKEIQSEITDIPSIIIPNRAVAVEQAIEQASPGDVVLLLGKGHEKFIALEVGQREYEGDKAIALKAIKRVYEGEEENELQQND